MSWISARRPKKSPTAPKKFERSSPIAAVGTALGYGPPEPEQVPYALVMQRPHDEMGAVGAAARDRRHADHGHAGGPRGGDAGLRVLERDALRRVGAELRRRGEIDVGRGLRALDVLGADDRREALVDARRPQRPRGELAPRVRRQAERDAAFGERVEQLDHARHRLDAGAVELVVDELAQLDAQLVAAARLAEVALHRERRLLPRRAEHLALVVEREPGAVARVQRRLGAGPRVLGVERQAV